MESEDSLPADVAAPDASRPVAPQALTVEPVTFELPTAREVVGRGLDLSLSATRQLRGASLYVGLLLVALVGPAITVGVALSAAVPGGFEEIGRILTAAGQSGVFSRTDLAGAITTLSVLAVVGMVGAYVVIIEAEIVAVALLAGLLACRPLTLREALARSRQTFWRVAWASILLAIPLQIASWTVSSTLVVARLPDEVVTIVVMVVGAILGAPFGYLLTGIVVGDVGPVETIGRSFLLARTRWRLAAIIAGVSLVASSIEVLALGAGADIVLRLGDLTGLGFDSDAAHSIATLVVLLAVVVAVGSLIFTVTALVAAPQVVAFIGLTHYTTGLELARVAPALQVPVEGWVRSEADAHPRRAARLVTRPMALVIACSVLLAFVTVVDLLGSR